MPPASAEISRPSITSAKRTARCDQRVGAHDGGGACALTARPRQQGAAGGTVRKRLRTVTLVPRGAGGAALIAHTGRMQRERVGEAARIAGARHFQLGHGGDAGQRLTTKAERGDALQVGQRAHFAGGVRAAGQRELLRRDAAPVVD